MRTKQENVMQSKLFRKLISMILVVVMVFSNGAFAQLTPVVQAATEKENGGEEEGKSFTITADIDLHTQNGGNANKKLYTPGGEKYIIGRGRVYYVQYDLSEVIQAMKDDPKLNVYDAQLILTHANSSGNNTELRYISYNDWAENPQDVTYNTMEAAIDGGQFAPEVLEKINTKTGAKNGAAFSVDVSKVIKRANLESNGTKYSFNLTGTGTSGTEPDIDESGVDVYSVACKTENYRPRMEITLKPMTEHEIAIEKNTARVQKVVDALGDTYEGLNLDADMVFPTSDSDVTIEWKSTDEKALSFSETEGGALGHITRNETKDQAVTVVATCSYGEGEEKVTVEQIIKVKILKEKTVWEENGYQFTTYKVFADIDLHTQNGGSANTKFYTSDKESYVIGRGRAYYVQYDLKNVIDTLQKNSGLNVYDAQIKVFRKASAGNNTELRYISYNDWAEKPASVTWNTMEEDIAGGQFSSEVIDAFSTRNIGTNQAFSANATKAVNLKNAEKNGTKFSFNMTDTTTSGSDTDEQDGLDVWSVACKSVKYAYRPYIEVTLANMPQNEIDKKQNETRAQSVADNMNATYGGLSLDEAPLVLPTKSLGVDIEWKSSDAAIALSQKGNNVIGTITQEEKDGEDKLVVLTVACSYGEGNDKVTVTKEIKVNVLKKNDHIKPAEMVGISSKDINKTLVGTTAEISPGKSVVTRFDISTIPEDASKVYVFVNNVTGNNGNRIFTRVFTLPSDYDVSKATHADIFTDDTVNSFRLEGAKYVGDNIYVPKKEETGQLDVTRAVKNAQKAGENTVVIGFAGNWTGNNSAKIATNTWLDGSQKTYMYYEDDVAENRIKSALKEASAIDETVQFYSFDVPVKTDSGASLTWKSESPYLKVEQADDSQFVTQIVVTRPEGTEDVQAVLKVIASYNGMDSETQTYTITIPAKENTVSPYLRGSLERMIEKANQLLDLAAEDKEYSEEELSKDFNDYLLRKTVPVFEENGTFTEPATGKDYQLVKKTEKTVPRVDLKIEDNERQLGQLSKKKYQELSEAVDAAMKVYQACTEEKYSAEVQHLLRAGWEFIKSGKTDDTLYTNKVTEAELWKLPAVTSDDTDVDSSADGFNKGARRYEKVNIIPGDELAYSSYRAYEEGLVWKSYALLAIEPELYPQSAKDALLEKVGDAEKALKGTYYVMYAQSRQFFQSRPDEQIQRTTSYQDKSWNFDDAEYGLDPVISWYRKQSIAAGVSYFIRGGVDKLGSEDTLIFENQTEIKGNTISTNTSNGSWLTSGHYGEDGYRLAFMQYNLGAITKLAPIYDAELWSTNTQGSTYLGEICLEKDVDDYTELTPLTKPGEHLYQMCQHWYKGFTSKVCVLDGVAKRAYEGSDKVTFSIRNIDPDSASKTEVYSSRGDVEVDYKGQLYVILEKINQKALSDKIDSEIKEHQELIDEADTYSGEITSDTAVGAYPQERVDAVQEAINQLKSAKDSEGVYELCALLKELDDRVLEMKDARALNIDIDKGANLFFTKEEVEELKAKIAEDSELEATYQKMEGTVNSQDPAKLMQLRYDKLDNDSATLESKYKLWYGASNCNLTPKKQGLTNIAKAYVTVKLPSTINDDAYEGKGFAWFDKISLSSTSGEEIEVPNNIYKSGASATRPAGWNAQVCDAKTDKVLADLKQGTFDSEKLSGKISDYVKWQTGDEKLAYSGSNSIYMHNKTADTYCIWTSDTFDMWCDDYTMSYQVKQPVKYTIAGVEVTFHYLDDSGFEIGTPNSFWTDVMGNIMNMPGSNTSYQDATVAYLVTGKEKYAKLAKVNMYLYLEEALLGAHSWENNYRHVRPKYGDVFGAVQNGRSAATLATMYAIMKDVRLENGSPLWSIDEKKQLVQQIRLLAGNLLDIRDRTHFSLDEISANIGNWETDQSMGAAMLGMAFAHDDGQEYTDEEVIAAGYAMSDGKADRDALEKDITLPHALRYFENTERIIEGATRTGIRDDGAWPESMNYHSAMFEKLGTFTRACSNTTGIDFFAIMRDYDDPEEQETYGSLSTLAKMLKYYTIAQAPRYVNGNAGEPGFGDGHYFSGNNFKYAGAYWHQIYEKYEEFKSDADKTSDPDKKAELLKRADAYHELARDLYGCWNRSGRQRPQEASEENVMQVFFAEPNWPEDDQEYLKGYSTGASSKSSDFMKYFGTYFMRNNFDVKDTRTGRYKESYVAFMAQLKTTAHNHYDEGAFFLYADSVPLVSDPGMDNYWSAGKTLLKSSSSHSTVQVKKGDGSYADVTEYVEDVDFYASDKMDKISTTLTYQRANGKVKRNYAFVKDGFEAHVIWDRVSGATFGSRMNLVLYTESCIPDKFTGNKIVADGFQGVNLEINVLQGNVDSYKGHEDIKASGALPSRPGSNTTSMDILRVENDGSENYLTVLFPTNDMGTRGTLTTSEVEISSKAKVDGYKLSHNNGKHAVYVAVNDRSEAETITLPETVQILTEEGTVYNAGEEITIQAGEMLLFSTNTSEEALETGTDEPKTAGNQSPTQPNTSSAATGGAPSSAAVSGGASNEESEIVKGNTNKVDLNAPGTSAAPNATVNASAEEGIFQLDVKDGNTAYYSVNGSDYMKYTGPVSVADGDKVIYFTVNNKSGVKTYGLRLTAKGGKKPKVPKKYGVAKGKRNKIRLYNAKGATNIKYKVTNKKIVAVSKNGRVRGKKIGNTHVTITFKLNGKSYKLKTLIKVKKSYRVER